MKSIPEYSIDKYVGGMYLRIFDDRLFSCLKYSTQGLLEHIPTDYIRRLTDINKIKGAYGQPIAHFEAHLQKHFVCASQ